MDERHEYTVGHRLYSAVELETLLTDVGFDDARAYGAHRPTFPRKRLDILMIVPIRATRFS